MENDNGIFVHLEHDGTITVHGKDHENDGELERHCYFNSDNGEFVITTLSGTHTIVPPRSIVKWVNGSYFRCVRGDPTVHYDIVPKYATISEDGSTFESCDDSEANVWSVERRFDATPGASIIVDCPSRGEARALINAIQRHSV